MGTMLKLACFDTLFVCVFRVTYDIVFSIECPEFECSIASIRVFVKELKWYEKQAARFLTQRCLFVSKAISTFAFDMAMRMSYKKKHLI